MRRQLQAVTIAMSLVVALAGCSSSSGHPSAGYVSADGVVEVFAPEERIDAPAFEGDTIDGEQWSSTDHDGAVLVVNFWYASCPPCRVEAPMLASLDATYPDAVFVGVNVRDGAPSAQAFDEEFGIEYPSLLDGDDGAVQLAFAGTVTPTAVPTTLVIDSDGTVAARISGAIPDEGVLAAILEDELAAT